MKFAVLGGGCVGVSTALQIQSEIRNADVTILAENFEQITSFVAAGIFRVGTAFTGPSEDITRKWVKDAYEYYEALSRSAEASDAGVTSISGYMFSNASPKVVRNDFMEKLVPIYRRATESELQLVGGTWKYGSFMSTLLTQPDMFIEWGRKVLTSNGGHFIRRKIDSFQEIVKDYDIIMNCTGLGSMELCKDNKMVPIKGQVIKVKAPWCKTFFYGELTTYIIPGADGLVTLGGNREFECSDLTICPYQSAAIRERCNVLVPSLKKAETITEKSGLRPYREGGVRVEAEKITSGQNTAMVIHNYGHGGYGICTAPGTSKYAVELAKDAHRSTTKL